MRPVRMLRVDDLGHVDAHCACLDAQQPVKSIQTACHYLIYSGHGSRARYRWFAATGSAPRTGRAWRAVDMPVEDRYRRLPPVTVQRARSYVRRLSARRDATVLPDTAAARGNAFA